MRSNISEVSSNVARISTELFVGAENSKKSSNIHTDKVSEKSEVIKAEVLTKEKQIKSENAKETSTDENDVKLMEAIETVTAFLQPQLRNVNFTHHENSGKTVVSIFDSESKELIKQFPSEKILDMADRIKGLQDEITSKTGMLFDDKV